MREEKVVRGDGWGYIRERGGIIIVVGWWVGMVCV